MSLIRSKWTKPERAIHNYLKGHKIAHKMHPRMTGSPDIIIPSKKIAIFIHGCFWHGCKNCYKQPKNNKKFWKKKIENNKGRDRKNSRLLRKNGWKIKIIWECDIPRNNNALTMRKIIKSLKLKNTKYKRYD